MRHFVSHGLSQALPALSLSVGEVVHGRLNTSAPLPGAQGCESSRSTAKVTSDGTRLSAGSLDFSQCRLVEVTVESSDELDTVEPQRAELRGYWAGAIQVWFAPGAGYVRLHYRHRNDRATDVRLAHHEIAEPSNDYFPLALGNRWIYRWTDEATGVQFEDTVFVAAHQGDEWNLAFVTAAQAPED